MEEVERWSEVERKSIVAKTRHNFYKQTKVIIFAQVEQSALLAGVVIMDRRGLLRPGAVVSW